VKGFFSLIGASSNERTTKKLKEIIELRQNGKTMLVRKSYEICKRCLPWFTITSSKNFDYLNSKNTANQFKEFSFL